MATGIIEIGLVIAEILYKFILRKKKDSWYVFITIILSGLIPKPFIWTPESLLSGNKYQRNY